MSWKVKVKIGEASMEIEIPLSERSVLSLSKDSTGEKTLEMVDAITERVIQASLKFEQNKFKKSETEWSKDQKLNS